MSLLSSLHFLAMILIKIQLHIFIFLNEICLAKSYKHFANCKMRAINSYPVPLLLNTNMNKSCFYRCLEVTWIKQICMVKHLITSCLVGNSKYLHERYCSAQRCLASGKSVETYPIIFIFVQILGPDICGPGTKKVHVIFNYKGKNLLTKKDIRCKVC